MLAITTAGFPHRPSNRAVISSVTPVLSLLRCTGSRVGNRAQKGKSETLDGQTRNPFPPDCAEGPGAACAASPVPRKFKRKSFQGPAGGPMPLLGGQSEAPAEGPPAAPRPTRAGGGRQHLPAQPHPPRPSETHPAAPPPSSSQDGGRPGPPSSATVRGGTGPSLSPGGVEGRQWAR